MSNAKTRVLYLEDDLNDRELVPRALAREGLQCEFVFAVTAAIVGARRPEQVEDTVAAAAVRLTQSDLKEIKAAAELAA